MKMAVSSDINDIYKVQTVAETATTKELKKLSELEGNCAYFSFSDCYVIELSKKRSPHRMSEERIYEDIERKLKIALLFFDRIIIHFADLIRNEKICDILVKYKNFVSKGVIEFLYSSSIKVINVETIRAYVMLKKGEGEKGLDAFVSNTGFADKVVDLLNCSNRIIRRGYTTKSREQFIDLVKKDMERTNAPYRKSARGTSTLYEIILPFLNKL